MAAFQFPDPNDTQTVVNPITGSTYQWKEPPGKWVVTTKLRGVSDIIYEGDNPPDPIGDYKLWYSTDTLELYFYFCDANSVCAWVPTSAPITMLEGLQAEVTAAGADIAVVKRNIIELEDDISNIVAGLGQVTLQEVLDNGSVADKGFVLTNMTSDAILVSPDEARVMIAAVEDVVPKYELRHTTGALDTSLVELELDENGKRFDIECDERVDNIHFRFNDDVKLALNKDGDAVFGGRVQADAATKDEELVNLGQFNEDQLRQDKALILLEGEIEQLAPSFARGTWNWDDGDGYVDSGEYVMRGIQTQDSKDKMLEPLNEELNACLADSQNPQDQSACLRAYDEAADKIPDVGDEIQTYDWELTNQIEFSYIDSQDSIQTFEDVKAGQILDMVCPDGAFMVAEITKVTAGQWYENPVLEYKPITTNGDANGLTKLKIFSIDDGIEVDELNNFVRKSGDTMDGHLRVTNPGKTDGTYLFSVRADGLGDDKVAFRVTADGKVKAGHDTSSPFIASQNNDVVTKKFTDDKLVKKSGDEMTGKLTITKPAGDSPTNSFIINQFVTDEDGNIEQKVLLKDYKPQKTATYKSSIFYYGLCDNDASLVNRGYANGHFFQLDVKNQTKEPIWIRPENEDGDIKGGAGVGNMLVVNQESGNQGSIVRIQQNGEDCLKVEVDQTVNLFGNRVKKLAYPTAGDDGKQDAANRDYVDQAVAAIQGGSGGLFEPSLWTLDLSLDRDQVTKGMFYADNDDFYMATSTANNATWVPGVAGGRTTNAWVTIYSTAGKLMHTYEVNKIYFKEKYGKKYITEFEWTWDYASAALVNGDQYKIIVPGFLT